MGLLYSTIYQRPNTFIFGFKERSRSFKTNEVFLGAEQVVPFKGTARWF